MHHVAASLTYQHSVIRHVLMMACRQTESVVVFSFERVNGVLVGSHTFVPEDESHTVLARLDDVVHEWRRIPAYMVTLAIAAVTAAS